MSHEPTTSSKQSPPLNVDFDSLKSPSLAPQRAPGQNLKLIAHQGYQDHQAGYPANSFGAINAAFGVADTVEFDVYAIPSSTDPSRKEVVVIHPEGYFLFVNSAGMKNEEQLPLSLEEALAVTARGRPLIPRLTDVLEAYQARTLETGKRTEMHIELKGPGVSEVIIPLLRQYVESGRLNYEDFSLTALCYPGDRSRITEARALDPHARIALVVRGGDLKVDGFTDWNEVLSFAREQRCDSIIGQRRLLDRKTIEFIKDGGFSAGCYHARTSDEVEAALALQADYVAADFFTGPSYESYSEVRLHGSPYFQELSQSGFYTLRDWIWELGWKYEGMVHEVKSTSAAMPPLVEPRATNHDAIVSIAPDGTTLLQVHEQGKLSSCVLDSTSWEIPNQFLGELERGCFNAPVTVGELLSYDGQLRLFKALCNFTLVAHPVLDSESIRHELDLLDIATLKMISERGIKGEVAVIENLPSREQDFLTELAREFLIRSGRIVGMLGFSALKPRHGPKEYYLIGISGKLCANSQWAQQGASQQIRAQLLRSGKVGSAAFE